MNDDYCIPSTSSSAILNENSNCLENNLSLINTGNINNNIDKNNINNDNLNEKIKIKRKMNKMFILPKILEIRLLVMMLILYLIIFPTFVISKKVYTTEEKTIMKRFILKKLGLEDMLNRNKNDFYSHNIPFYIYDFYDQAKEGNIELMRHYIPTVVIHDPNPEIDGWHVIYNLSATGRMPDKELVVKADLRLKINEEIPSAEEYQQQYVVEDDEEDDAALLTTSWEKYNVYEIDSELREVHRLMDTRFLPEQSLRRGNRWVDFDVTNALNRRRMLSNNQKDNDIIEFYIERISGDRTPMQIDLRESAALIVQCETSLAKNPGRQRRKRETNKKNGKQRKQHHSIPQSKDLCRLESLYIDFKDLDWDGWIISPSGYQAYQCRGKCTEMPPSAKQNYTNHAIMQSLIHSLNSSAVPPPCCVPTEMSSLSILFRDNKNITVVHNYPQMIVDACGCH